MEPSTLGNQSSVSFEATGRGPIALIRNRHAQALGSHPIGQPDWGAMAPKLLPQGSEDLHSSIHEGSDGSEDPQLWGHRVDSNPQGVRGRSDSVIKQPWDRGLPALAEGPECGSSISNGSASESEESARNSSMSRHQASVEGFLSYLKRNGEDTMGPTSKRVH
jgi:hypothetical protein